MQKHRLLPRLIGFGGSLILTLTAFFIVVNPEFFHLQTGKAILAIYVLGFMQFVVQCIFFLNLLSEKGPRPNLMAFVSTLPIVVIIIVFSIWVMNHLDYNMMPKM